MEHKFYIGDPLDLLGKRMTIIKPGWCVHGMDITNNILLQGTIVVVLDDFAEVEFDNIAFNHVFFDCMLIHGFTLEKFLE